ncbi:unnamed protein product [Periconia digitata]|uniref:C2H2-type domain-containing protein n=1 Tax=Periconia digitata TaxID=1303443 RepID=A0A9W4UPP5_9PLEO|nr:unnamed protein product [Periconia digitata]
METATLRELGRDVLLQFGTAFLALSTETNRQPDVGSEDTFENSRENFNAEQERFQLWAANLGLQASGDRSLDYRVQDSPSVKSYTRQLLEELIDDLKDLPKLLRDGPSEAAADQWSEEDDDEAEQDDEEEGKEETQTTSDQILPGSPADEDDPEDDSSEAGSEEAEYVELGSTAEAVQSTIEDISDIIDRLYRLASKLRNSATRAPPSARNFYREPLMNAQGEEIQLTQSERKAAKEQTEQFHQQRIEEIVLQTLRDERDEPYTKTYCTPYLSPRTTAVIRRISVANAYRQQQFAFWRSREWDRRHAVKYQAADIAKPLLKAEGPQSDNQEAQRGLDGLLNRQPFPTARSENQNPFSEAPSATWKMLKEPTLSELDDTRSLTSKTEYTSSPTIYEPSGRKVGWPTFPKELGKKKDFICPYCFVTCPANYRGKGHWRAHLIQDLQPYTCTAEKCDEGDSKPLNTWDEWIVHEQVHHRMEYTCRYHPESAFSSRDQYLEHVGQEHPHQQNELLDPDHINANAQLTPKPRDGCPICSYQPETWQDMDKHLAYHLENLALLSLPLATGLEREDANMGSLQQEGGEDDAMGLLDGDAAGALSSLFETIPAPLAEDGTSLEQGEVLTEEALSKHLENEMSDGPPPNMLQDEHAPEDLERTDYETGVGLYEAMAFWDLQHIDHLFPKASQTLKDRLARANTDRRRRMDMLQLRKTTKPSSSRENEKNEILSRALQKANTAVLLDNAENFQGAIEAYSDSCELLQQVSFKSNVDADKKKVESIRLTYLNRIEELKHSQSSNLDDANPNSTKYSIKEMPDHHPIPSGSPLVPTVLESDHLSINMLATELMENAGEEIKQQYMQEVDQWPEEKKLELKRQGIHPSFVRYRMQAEKMIESGKITKHQLQFLENSRIESLNQSMAYELFVVRFNQLRVLSIHCPICNLEADYLSPYHIEQDVPPYVCLYENCSSGDMLYSQASSLQTHMSSHLVPLEGEDMTCPLCLEASFDISHIVVCLQRAASFVLPRNLSTQPDTSSDFSGSAKSDWDIEEADDKATEKELPKPLPENDWDLHEETNFDQMLTPHVVDDANLPAVGSHPNSEADPGFDFTSLKTELRRIEDERLGVRKHRSSSYPSTEDLPGFYESKEEKVPDISQTNSSNSTTEEEVGKEQERDESVDPPDTARKGSLQDSDLVLPVTDPESLPGIAERYDTTEPSAVTGDDDVLSIALRIDTSYDPDETILRPEIKTQTNEEKVMDKNMIFEPSVERSYEEADSPRSYDEADSPRSVIEREIGKVTESIQEASSFPKSEWMPTGNWPGDDTSPNVESSQAGGGAHSSMPENTSSALGIDAAVTVRGDAERQSVHHTDMNPPALDPASESDIERREQELHQQEDWPDPVDPDALYWFENPGPIESQPSPQNQSIQQDRLRRARLQPDEMLSRDQHTRKERLHQALMPRKESKAEDLFKRLRSRVDHTPNDPTQSTKDSGKETDSFVQSAEQAILEPKRPLGPRTTTRQEQMHSTRSSGTKPQIISGSGNVLTKIQEDGKEAPKLPLYGDIDVGIPNLREADEEKDKYRRRWAEDEEEKNSGYYD